MKKLGAGTIVTGLIMLGAGMSGVFTQTYSHDTILMILGGVFALAGVMLIAIPMKKPSE